MTTTTDYSTIVLAAMGTIVALIALTILIMACRRR